MGGHMPQSTCRGPRVICGQFFSFPPLLEFCGSNSGLQARAAVSAFILSAILLNWLNLFPKETVSSFPKPQLGNDMKPKMSNICYNKGFCCCQERT